MMSQPPPGSSGTGVGANKMAAAASQYPSPHSRYAGQYPVGGYDGRRPMPNAYPGQGHWYPAAPGRGDAKPPWTGWGGSQPHGYSQAYFYGGGAPAGSPQHMQQQSPHAPPTQHTTTSTSSSTSSKYPSPLPHQQTSPHSMPQKAKPTEGVASSPVVATPQSTPPAAPASSIHPEPIKPEDFEVQIMTEASSKHEFPDTPKRSSSSSNDRQKAKRGRPGPKSRIERKQLQQQHQHLQEQQVKQQNETNSTISQVNNSPNPTILTPPPPTINSSMELSDSSDSDDQEPRLAVLKPARRFRGPDGSFVGPKRIKLAKMVRQRQHTRQKLIQDQLRQCELEEQLAQQWVEKSSVQEGPLAHVLLKSSLLLCDSNVDQSDVMDEHIASMTAQHLPSSSAQDQEQLSPGKDKLTSNNGTGGLAGKKPGRKATASKVLHNNNSVVVKTISKQKSMPKLRAKDFKWSHYIKTMRYWCKDCGHGFKNQRDSVQHCEEQCKNNCLYMIECYVNVGDIVQHKVYGNKVSQQHFFTSS